MRNPSRLPLSIAAVCAPVLLGSSGCGRLPLAVAGPSRDPAPVGVFRDVARQSGIDFRWGHGGRSPLNIIETLGHGCAILDFDQDGRMDVLMVGERRCALYRNLGDGRFSDVSSAARVTAEGDFRGIAVGDYDNDGYPDLYITGYGKCVLYHNDRHGGFADVTSRSRVAALSPYDVVTAAAFVDLDGDGRLDLYAGRYIRFGPETIHFCYYRGVRAGCGVKNYDPVPPHVYRNNGDGTFSDVTKAWGFGALHGRCLGVAACVDEARNPMLYVANDELPGDLMVRHGRAYTNIGVRSGTAYNHDGLTQGGMGTDWGDYDNDGRPDLAVTTFQNEPNSLYHNDGARMFSELGASLGVAADSTANVGWSVRFVDYDNDGWQDLFITNGHSQDNADKIEPDRTYAQRMQLYHNEAGRVFRLASNEGGPSFDRPIVGRGAAFGDLDNDGRTDAVVVDEEGTAQVLHNDSATNHWLGVRLLGAGSNRDGIGARVRVTVAERSFVRAESLCGGYLSSHDPRLLFGLGSARGPATIEVYWPDGHVDVARSLAADRYIEVREGQGTRSAVTAPPHQGGRTRTGGLDRA